MSSVQICSPRTKNISSFQHYNKSSATMFERSSIALTAVSHIKTQKAIPLNTTRNSVHSTTMNHTKTTQKSARAIQTSVVSDMLSVRGYKKMKTISPTLQGQVFIATKTAFHRDSLLVFGYIREVLYHTQITNIFQLCYRYMQTAQTVVIKRTDKRLHRHKISISDSGASFKVKEDIVKEACLMKMFQRRKQPSSMIKYYDFCEDSQNFYLVMEHGGQGLFEFVVDCHQLITQGKLALKEWKRAVRYIFAKMVGVLHWMHNVVRCCNLDISLENVVMGKNTYIELETGKIKNLEIRFIDFGLTERFDRNNPTFMCDKYVGKQGYKAPKVFAMNRFCANKADIWSLGVCLFMMSVGAPIYKKPSMRDQGFRVLQSHKVLAMLQNWDRLKYIGQNQYDLLMKMLNINETQRYDISAVMKHPWIKSYFTPRPKKRISRKFEIKMKTNDTMALHIRDSVSENKHRNRRESQCSIPESQTFELIEESECCAAVDKNENETVVH